MRSGTEKPGIGSGRLVAAVTAALCAMLSCVRAASAQPLRERIDRANAMFSEGRRQEALDAYQKAAEVFPDSPELAFNRAAAHLALDQLDEAEALLKQVESTPGASAELGAAAQYNRGLIDFRRAKETAKTDPKKAVPLLRQSERRFRNALAASPGDADAARNVEVAQRTLKSVLDEIEKRKQERSQQQQRQNQQNQQQSKDGRQQQGQQQDQRQGQGSESQSKNQQSQQDQQQKNQELADKINDLAEQQQSAAEQSKRLEQQKQQAPDQASRDQANQKQQELAQKQKQLSDQTKQAAEQLRQQAAASQDQKTREQLEQAAKAAEQAQPRQQQAEQDLQQCMPDQAAKQQESAAKDLAQAAQRAREASGKPEQDQEQAQASEGQPRDGTPREFNVTAAQILEKEAKDRERLKAMLRAQRGRARPVDKDW